MCHFLSVLVLQNGDILTHPMLDSHSDLVTYFKLPDTNESIRRFVKVELIPVNWIDPSTWRYTVDEENPPMWFTETMSESVADTLRSRASRMILSTGKHTLIVDGCWVIGGDANVSDIRAGRLVHVGGSAQVHNVRGSAQVRNVGDSAQVHNVGDSAQVHDVWGSAQVHNVGDLVYLDDSAKAHLVK